MRRVLIASCVLLSMIVPALPAQGAGPVSYAKVATTIGAGKKGTVKVPCPRGTKVTGGGVENVGGTLLNIHSSAPYDSQDAGEIRDDGWRVRVRNQGSNGLKVKAFAVCQKGGTYEYFTTTPVAAPAGERTNSIDVFCAKGFHVVGGGVDIAGTGALVSLAQSGPIDDGDDGAVRDNGWVGGVTVLGPDAQTLQVFAICESINTYSYVEQSLPASASSSQVVQDSCPSDYRAVGGGVTIDGTMNSFLHESFPAKQESTEPLGQRWINTVGMGSTGSTKNSSVICRSVV